MKYSAISALLLASTLPIAANAAPVCDQREKFLETLRKLYSEDLSAIGVTAEGKLVETIDFATLEARTGAPLIRSRSLRTLAPPRL